MLKPLLFLSLLVTLSLSIPINLEELRSLWSSWKIYYGKSYSTTEEAARFAIFIENYKKIVTFNSKHTTVKQALNKFADITGEEFKYLQASCHEDQPRNPKQSPTPIDDNTDIKLPSSVDWRQKGAVGPVQDQGNCGACWAFAGIGSLEGLYFIDTGKLVIFSEQQLVDCVSDSSGCSGGTISAGLAYVASHGIETEADYPYQGEGGDCQYNQSKAIRVSTGFEWVPFRNANALKSAVVKQPVPVAVEADQDAFQFYSSGVIGDGCGTTTDHGVLVVGYETVSGQEAYIVQNSWGADWGLDGYVYISTDGSLNGGNGACGILTGPVIPVK